MLIIFLREEDVYLNGGNWKFKCQKKDTVSNISIEIYCHHGLIDLISVSYSLMKDKKLDIKENCINKS